MPKACQLDMHTIRASQSKSQLSRTWKDWSADQLGLMLWVHALHRQGTFDSYDQHLFAPSKAAVGPRQSFAIVLCAMVSTANFSLDMPWSA